jgi:alpha-D-ribose 1-methylphosphonate 5-triphosphate diphosphatase
MQPPTAHQPRPLAAVALHEAGAQAGGDALDEDDHREYENDDGLSRLGFVRVHRRDQLDAAVRDSCVAPGSDPGDKHHPSRGCHRRTLGSLPITQAETLMAATSDTARKAEWTITGARILMDDGHIEDVCVRIAGMHIAEVTADEGNPSSNRIDAGERSLLPGIVDLHGDAFEHLLMPRPNVYFAAGLALAEVDRQVCSNGITTAFHGLTYSWEPGLRSADTVRNVIDTLDRLDPELGADTRIHLRYEMHSVDAADEVEHWIREGRVSLLSLNDHAESIRNRLDRPEKLSEYTARSGMSAEDYAALVQHVIARGEEVDATVSRLCAAAREQGLIIASHDDESPQWRRHFRAMGAGVCEFPWNRETAQEAITETEPVILGAPNVLRGRSHDMRLDALSAIANGLCTALASDYYYPSLAAAPFELVRLGMCALPTAWSLVSSGPANAAGLTDRGRLEPGMRADLVLLDMDADGHPAITATVAGGRIVHAATPDLFGILSRAA